MEVFNLKLFESKVSLIFTLGFIFIYESLDIYNNFNEFQIAFQNIAIYIAAALIGMLGIILAGISIMTSSLNRDNMKLMEILNDKYVTERVLVSFEFLAFLIGIQVIVFFNIYLILHSSMNLIPKPSLYFIIIPTVYIFIFSLFYTVSLVGDSIQFFLTTKTYDKINELDKSIISIANELRIDFILKLIIENGRIDDTAILNSLIKYCEISNFDKKEEVLKYLKSVYDIDK